MTYPLDKSRPFSRFLCVLPALAIILTLASCATAISQSSSQAPLDTGAYPDLNVPPQAAAPQLTPQEARSKIAEMERLRRSATSQPGTATTGANAARLRELGRTHGADVLREIEGE